MDETITIKPDVWIITEGSNIPAYYIYELISGRVSTYRKGSKVNEVEVKEGEDSVFLGIIAAMRDDRARTASIKTETEIKVIEHSIDQVWGILTHEIPADLRAEVDTMVEAISTKNELDVLNERLASLPHVSAHAPDHLKGQAKTIINEVAKLYNDVVK